MVTYKSKHEMEAMKKVGEILAAQYEHTITITKDGPIILTDQSFFT